MYDFCFTYPYATLLALGGCFGYAAKGSLPSLLGGLGSAAVLAVCAQLSLNAYHAVSPAPKSCSLTQILIPFWDEFYSS